MRSLDRRDFVTTAVGGLGLLHARPLDALERLGDRAGAAAQAVRLRRNVYCMNAASPAIVAYKKAVEVMRARPASNPTSWQAQANIHGANAPVAGMLADACEHGNTFFLSWHRMYLHYFERIARAASGDPNFSLPYWGFGPASAATRVLPEVFRTPAAASNPLWTSQRSASVNGGAALSTSAVDAGAAMTHVAFGSWSSAVEFTPHAQVHTAVGGGGWMSFFETAGLDPIFWLHHCNVDRLWELWLAQGGGRVNPSSGAWSTTAFQFYDENGATVSMTGAQIVDTAGQLSYRYASPLCLRPFPRDWWKLITVVQPIDPRLLERLRRISLRPPLPRPRPLAEAPEPVRVGAGRTVVRLRPAADARRALETFADDQAAGNQLALVLEDVRVEQPAAVLYEVYLGLAPNETPTVTSPAYVGNLNLFRPQKGDRPLTQALPVLPAYLRLRGAGRLRGDALDVTIVARGATDVDKPEALLGGRPGVTVGRLRLQAE